MSSHGTHDVSWERTEHSESDGARYGAERIVLGCAQPGQQIGMFKDALRRLSDRLHYLNSANNRFWFDTRPNLRREWKSANAASRTLTMFSLLCENGWTEPDHRYIRRNSPV